MRIGYLRSQFWFNLQAGGSVGHTAGVLNALHQLGHEPHVATTSELVQVKAEIPQHIQDPAILPLVPLDLQEHWNNGRFAAFAQKALAGTKPDVFYHRYSGASCCGVVLQKELGVPLILEFNSSDAWKIENWGKLRQAKGPKGWAQKLYRNHLLGIVKRNEELNLQQADLVVAVSDPLRDDLLARGMRADKILVNANGVDPEKFQPQHQKVVERCKKELGISAGKTVVGFSGTFGVWHGIPQLNEAISHINENGSADSVVFLLMGKGPLLASSQRELAKIPNVVFTGVVPYDRIQEYLGACDILVSPHCPHVGGKEFFGSPTKIFEYMAMGKAIVASRLGQIGRVLEHGKTAWMVEPGNVEELVAGIANVANDRALRKAMGENARKRALQRHTWAQHVKRSVDAFERAHG